MYLEFILPLIGALVLVGWMASGAWALRPAATDRAQLSHTSSLAAAQAARGLTRNGLIGALTVVVVGFLAVRVLFELPGWFQWAWAIGIALAAYIVWRVALLWPTAEAESTLRATITSHGMRPVRLPWVMILVGAALLGLWFLPPLLLF